MGKNLVRDIMANKNIEININNGNGYDVLYPKTTLSNVVDWANTIYSKSQVEAKIKEFIKTDKNWKFYGNKTVTFGGRWGTSGWDADIWKGEGNNLLVPNQDFVYKDWAVYVTNLKVNNISWAKNDTNIYFTVINDILTVGYFDSTTVSTPMCGGGVFYFSSYFKNTKGASITGYQALVDFPLDNDNVSLWGNAITQQDLRIDVIRKDSSKNKIINSLNVTISAKLYCKDSVFKEILL